MKLWYRCSLVCGLIPLLLGTATFFWWFITDLHDLLLVGNLVILGGIVLFLAGMVCVLVYVLKARRAQSRYKRAAVASVTVLLLNFFVCAGYILIAVRMMTTYIVIVTNDYREPIRDLVIKDPADGIYRVATVQPAAIAKACFRFKGEGAVTYAMTNRGSAQTGQLFGYVTSGYGGTAKLSLSQDGLVQTEDQIFRRISAGDYIRVCLL